MRQTLLGLALLAILIVPVRAWAQAGAVDSAASAASTASTAATGATGAASGGGSNLWSFLCPTPAQLAACKAKLCKCCLVQLLSAQADVFGSLSGGCIKPCCPKVDPADSDKPADSAEGAAARVRECEMGAKKRADAVRYLGTAPCARFPEAEKALINALRADCSECVRLEAARALGRGCCCTKATIAALLLSVNGSDKDGNPKECSPRVRAMAYQALVHCVELYCESVPATPPEKPSPLKPAAPAAAAGAVSTSDAIAMVGYYRQFDGVAGDAWIQQVRQAVQQGPPVASTQLPLPAGHRNLANCLVQARAGVPPQESAAPPVMTAAPARPVTQTAVQTTSEPARPRSLFGVMKRAFASDGGQ